VAVEQSVATLRDVLPELPDAEYAAVEEWDQAIQKADEVHATYTGAYLAKIRVTLTSGTLAGSGMWSRYLEARGISDKTARNRIARAEAHEAALQQHDEAKQAISGNITAGSLVSSGDGAAGDEAQAGSGGQTAVVDDLYVPQRHEGWVSPVVVPSDPEEARHEREKWDDAQARHERWEAEWERTRPDREAREREQRKLAREQHADLRRADEARAEADPRSDEELVMSAVTEGRLERQAWAAVAEHGARKDAGAGRAPGLAGRRGREGS
jgi:hypothetical protein